MADLANNPRAVETQQASGNNSIISTLSGAASPQPMSAPPAPAPAPTPAPAQPAAGGDFSAVQGVVPQGAINAATQMSDQLYGRGTLQGAESASENVIKQLFQYDQMLDKGYSPFPQVQGYVENPADMYAGGAAFAGGMSNIQGGINRGMSTIESGYQAAISGLLDKFMSFYEMKQQEEEKKKERESADKRERLEYEMAMADLMGGYVTDPYTGERKFIPSKNEREARSSGGSAEQKKALEAAALEKIFGIKPTVTGSGLNIPKSSQGTSKSGLEQQPNYSGSYRVVEKATGRTGTIPSNEFDPSKYTFIK